MPKKTGKKKQEEKKMLKARKTSEVEESEDEPKTVKQKKTAKGKKDTPAAAPPSSPKASKREKKQDKKKKGKAVKEEEEEKKETKKGKAVKRGNAQTDLEKRKQDDGKKKDAATASESEEEEDKKEEKKMVVCISKGRTGQLLGGVVVDPYVPNASKYKVVVEGSAIFNKDLMYSDVVHNNNKVGRDDPSSIKYNYQKQIQAQLRRAAHYSQDGDGLEKKGRLGSRQERITQTYERNKAKTEFTKKFFQKTGKGYKEIQISYENKEEDQEEEEDGGEEKKKAESKLSKKVKALMEMIFDVKTLDNTLKQIGYDAKKMPLGRLSEKTLNEGYEWLDKISKVLSKQSAADLSELCSQFYTCIPHDFGRQHMSNFIIKTEEDLKKKIEVLDTLKDMTVASKIIKEGKKGTENPADAHYRELECDLLALDPDSDRFKLLEKYYNNTSKGYWDKTQIVDIFEIARHGEEERFNKGKGDLPNHMLLWHGSRVSNFGGILRQGLRIAPPQAPAAGYNFGKGLYFADMATKSLNYCRASGSSTHLLIMLVEVAVGNPNLKMNFDFNAAKLPTGKDSTWGVGTEAPPDSSVEIIDKGVKVPAGEGAPNPKGKYLGFNEFIVYDVTQVRLRYLLRCEIK